MSSESAENQELSDEEINFLLERFDQTEPGMQRRIVANVFSRLAKAGEALADAKIKAIQSCRAELEKCRKAQTSECCRKALAGADDWLANLLPSDWKVGG